MIRIFFFILVLLFNCKKAVSNLNPELKPIYPTFSISGTAQTAFNTIVTHKYFGETLLLPYIANDRLYLYLALDHDVYFEFLTHRSLSSTCDNLKLELLIQEEFQSNSKKEILAVIRCNNSEYRGLFFVEKEKSFELINDQLSAEEYNKMIIEKLIYLCIQNFIKSA
jgi:hypothetical protein